MSDTISTVRNFAGLPAGFGTCRAIGAADAPEETSTDLDLLAEFREAAQDQAERESGPRRKAWLKLATAIENAEARFADDLAEIRQAMRDDATPSHGHCDACGAPCDEHGCTGERSHQIANPAEEEDAEPFEQE